VAAFVQAGREGGAGESELAAYDFSATRLFVDAPLGHDAKVELDRGQANYLLSVLRLKDGDAILAFNGRDGEWRARIASGGRKAAALVPTERVREQPEPSRLVYLFAPLKHARLDYMVQKAVEMGVGRLQPVFTRRTVASRVNEERMRANAVEAAEQCGILAVPEIGEAAPLWAALDALPPETLVIFCDEEAPVADPLAALSGADVSAGCALVIGPEGGFDGAERSLLLARAATRRLSLGPRILRADTAAVAALAIVQAAIGDWRAP
jgi:16S rRNA (uracil1498-N3)-methyltransferase